MDREGNRFPTEGLTGTLKALVENVNNHCTLVPNGPVDVAIRALIIALEVTHKANDEAREMLAWATRFNIDKPHPGRVEGKDIEITGFGFPVGWRATTPTMVLTTLNGWVPFGKHLMDEDRWESLEDLWATVMESTCNPT